VKIGQVDSEIAWLEDGSQKKINYERTRNAWQSLVWSPLGVIVSPPGKYLWNTPNYWSPCL